MANASTHYGNDPMGAPAQHRGTQENCPAPECQDRVIESMGGDYKVDTGAEYPDDLATEAAHRVEAWRAERAVDDSLDRLFRRLGPPPTDRATEK